MKSAVKIVAAACFALPNYSATAANDITANCRIGIYHLRDGSDVDIGQGKDSHLRWRRKDGTSGELTETANGAWTSTFGWTSRSDGKRVSFSECGKGAITFAGVKGERIALAVHRRISLRHDEAARRHHGQGHGGRGRFGSDSRQQLY